MSVLELFVAGLALAGSVLMLLASLGLLNLPDVYTRLSATSKASTLGAACLLLAGGVYFHEVGLTSRALATIAFLFLTAPVAAHMIGRAAYVTRVPLWEGTKVDELRGAYDPETLRLAGRVPGDAEGGGDGARRPPR
jgi:multicomponent Na+:H+ antiporter subunit G